MRTVDTEEMRTRFRLQGFRNASLSSRMRSRVCLSVSDMCSSTQSTCRHGAPSRARGGTVNYCNLRGWNALQSSGRPPFSNLLIQRLRSVGNGLALCSVRDGGSIARLSVFVKRPAETAIPQKIGFNPDGEWMIFGHLANMRALAECFPARGLAANFKLIHHLKEGTLILFRQGIRSIRAAMRAQLYEKSTTERSMAPHQT